MRTMTTRMVGGLALATILVAACSSTGATPSPSAAAPSTAVSGPASAPASAAGSPVAAKDATSAAAMGGVDAVCAAGKAEGQVNIIATPPDWANYGQIITDF